MYKLYKGDCLEVMKEIPTGSVDMILCDLPYGTTECKWDSIIPLDRLWKEYERIIKEDGAIVLTAAQPFTTHLIESNIKRFRYCWYWVKNTPTGFCFAKYQPMRRVEDVCVFYKKAPKYNPQGLVRIEKPKSRIRKPLKSEDWIYGDTLNGEFTPQWTNYPSNVLNIKSERGFHPTQKPVPLFEYLIKTYTDEGMTVLDNCMGSGTTGVACMNTNRKFIGIELNEKYFNVAKERIEGSLTQGEKQWA